jgi:RNA polymerase sigma-70 factor (ECF subfamily)
MDFRPACASGSHGQGFVESDELEAPDTRDQDDDSLRFRQIMLRVNALPEAQRNTVFLVYVEGFTYQEAAETLSVPSARL